MAIAHRFLRPRATVAFCGLVLIAMGNTHIPDPLPTLLILASIPVGAGVSYFRPVDILALLAASVPLQAYGAVDVAGTSVTLTKLCIACLVIGWLPRVVAGKRVPIDSALWGYLLVAAALGVSIVAEPDVIAWLAELYRWLVTIFVFIVARAEIQDRTDVNRLLLGVSAGVVGVSSFSFHQVLTHNGPQSFVVNGLLRAYGTFGQPNPLAAFMELSLPLLAAMLVLPTVRAKRSAIPTALQWTMAMAVATGTVTIFLTQSRGGWIGMAAACVILLGSLPPRIQVAMLGGALGAVLVLEIAGWGNVPAERFASVLSSGGDRVNVTPRNWANEERRSHWEAAINMGWAHPWTGVGAGGFNDAYREYTTDWRFRVSRGHAHNGYLHMAAQAGAFGAIAFSVWVASIMVKLIGVWRSRGGSMWDGRAAGGLATIVAFALHSVVDYLNVLSLGIQLALVLAIALADLRDERPLAGEGTSI